MAEEGRPAPPDSFEAPQRARARHRAQSQSLSPTELTLFLYVFPSRSWCVRACVRACVWSQMTMSAEDLKQEGNALYKQGLYLKAAATYTSAIKLDKENGVLYR